MRDAIMRPMGYLIALGLLVAVAGWLTAMYHRLEHLRSHALAAWFQWQHGAHLRNEHLHQYAALFSLLLPQGNMMPRDIRRLIGDSERALSVPVDSASHSTAVAQLGATEQALRRTLTQSFFFIDEACDGAPPDMSLVVEELKKLVSLQDNLAHTFNKSVDTYNHAISEPTGRFVSSLFGFTPMAAIQLGADNAPG